jgi:hypothetical protein
VSAEQETISGEGRCAACDEYRRVDALPLAKVDGHWVMRAVNPCACGETRIRSFHSDPIRETISRRSVGKLPP